MGKVRFFLLEGDWMGLMLLQLRFQPRSDGKWEGGRQLEIKNNLVLIKRKKLLCLGLWLSDVVSKIGWKLTTKIFCLIIVSQCTCQWTSKTADTTSLSSPPNQPNETSSPSTPANFPYNNSNTTSNLLVQQGKKTLIHHLSETIQAGRRDDFSHRFCAQAPFLPLPLEHFFLISLSLYNLRKIFGSFGLKAERERIVCCVAGAPQEHENSLSLRLTTAPIGVRWHQQNIAKH